MNIPKLITIACVAAASLFAATPAQASHWRHHHAYYYSRPYYYSYYRPHYYHHYRPYVYYSDPYYYDDNYYDSGYPYYYSRPSVGLTFSFGGHHHHHHHHW